MLNEIVRRLLPGHTSPTTYGLGILQAKSFRHLKVATAAALKKHGITSVDWAILGVVSENPEGLSLSAISKELGIQAPLVTVRANRLATKQLITITASQADSRQRMASLSTSGKRLMPTIERLLRDQLKPLFAGASARDLLGYISVLARIVKNKETDL